MGKKDKKSKTAEQKARVAAKQEKKATQKEKKGKTKGVTDSDAEDVDLEAIRAEYEQQVRRLRTIHPLHLSITPATFSKHNS